MGKRRHADTINGQDNDVDEVSSVHSDKSCLRWIGGDPNLVSFCEIGKSEKLSLSKDEKSLSGFKGFRSGFVSRGVGKGKWFCEMEVTEAWEGDDIEKVGHVRVGWGTWGFNLDGPVGFTTTSYGYRDVDGSKIHNGWREQYGNSFKKGDTIGLLIKWGKSKSYVRFYLNGKDQGVAYENLAIPDRMGYFAIASLYQNASVKVNGGPKFKYYLPKGAKPLCEASLQRCLIVLSKRKKQKLDEILEEAEKQEQEDSEDEDDLI